MKGTSSTTPIYQKVQKGLWLGYGNGELKRLKPQSDSKHHDKLSKHGICVKSRQKINVQELIIIWPQAKGVKKDI